MNRTLPLLLACGLFLSGSGLWAQPDRRTAVKRLYIANDDHTDYMWTADEAKYDSAFVQMLDYYLRQIDSTRNEPADFQARFNCDGSYWLRAYQKYRSPAQFDRLVAAIKSGHISSPLNLLVSTYGAQPTEAVLRGMYYAGSLERRYNLRFRLAQTMENNTIPLGLSSLWAGSGAKYNYKGIGGYGSQMTYEYRANRRNQLYYYTGLDGSRVLTKWYEYPDEKSAFGGYAECRFYPKKRPVSQTVEIEQVIDKLDAYCNTPRYPFNIAAAFGYGWDDLSTFVSVPFITAAKNKTTDTRKVRISNEIDFFEDVEKSYPNLSESRTSTESVSYGNEWDIYCASMNETTARVRRSVETLRAAEGLAAVVSLGEPHFADALTPAREQAWEALGMYWEHNWTADGPISRGIRAAWQTKLQTNLSRYVDSLHALAARRLGSQLKKTASPRFYVFNPLSWVRNDVADFPYEGIGPVRVIDIATNKEASSQRITKGGKPFIRILADGIPSVGYKVFEIRAGQPGAKPIAADVSVQSGGLARISNAFYTLKLSPTGVITEWLDRKAGNKSLVLPNKFLNDLGIQNLTEGTLTVENKGPVSVTLKAVSGHPILHTVRLTLFANSRTRTGGPAGPPRIEIEDSILVNFANVRQWSFAFNLKNQTTRHEELGAVLTARKETRGGHYAAQNARLDWQTFNHFADLSEAKYGVTLSNQDCSFFKLGESTATADRATANRVDSLWEDSPVLHALAGGQVDKKREDGGYMGIFNQNGQKAFRYSFALTTHRSAFDPTAAMKFSLEHQNPLVTGLITGERGNDAATFSLLTVDDPNVLLWSVKPAEEGPASGLITRFWNLASRPANPVIRLAKPIGRAWQTTHIETDERAVVPSKGVLKASFNQHQIKTYRLQFDK